MGKNIFKGKRKPRRRRPARRRGRRGARLSKNPAFPESLYAKLKYNRQMQLLPAPALNDQGQDIFILANGLNPIGNPPPPTVPPTLQAPLPTVAVTGTQPGEQLWNNLKNYAPMYSRMTVLSTKIKITIMGDSVGNSNTNTNLQFMLAVWPYNNNLDISILSGMNTRQLQQQKGVKTRMISTTAGSNKCVITMSRATKRMLGVKDIMDNEDGYCTLNPQLIATPPNPLDNPSNSSQWFFQLRAINNTGVAAQFTFGVEMWANVKFTSRTLYDLSYAAPVPPLLGWELPPLVLPPTPCCCSCGPPFGGPTGPTGCTGPTGPNGNTSGPF